MQQHYATVNIQNFRNKPVLSEKGIAYSLAHDVFSALYPPPCSFRRLAATSGAPACTNFLITLINTGAIPAKKNQCYWNSSSKRQDKILESG
jgi:hypothetical protein